MTTKTIDVKYRSKVVRLTAKGGRYDLLITLMETEASQILGENGYDGSHVMFTLLSSGIPKADYDFRRMDVRFPSMVRMFLADLMKAPRKRFETLEDDGIYDEEEMHVVRETKWSPSDL